MFFFQVDIAYAPFIERFQPFSLEVKKYDIIAGRPNLAAWIKVQLSLSEPISFSVECLFTSCYFKAS